MYKRILQVCCLSLLLPWATGNAQVTKADYQRADTILKLENQVYSPAVKPHWLGDSHFFWYQNREKTGTVFYLVDAETGKKNKAADKQGLAVFLKGKHKPLADELLKEEAKPQWNYRRQSDKPVE